MKRPFLVQEEKVKPEPYVCITQSMMLSKIGDIVWDRHTSIPIIGSDLTPKKVCFEGALSDSPHTSRAWKIRPSLTVLYCTTREGHIGGEICSYWNFVSDFVSDFVNKMQRNYNTAITVHNFRRHWLAFDGPQPYLPGTGGSGEGPLFGSAPPSPLYVDP